MMTRLFAAVCLSLASPLGASEFRLAWPVDCRLGLDCFIQQYVDHDPGPQATDFTCGTLSYDGHKGTDIALPSLRRMDQGVTVHAAAAGVVAGLRDGMTDAYASPERSAEIDGRDCGNGVVLRHPDGWETQYCHLKQGSVLVQKGARVARGAPLGEIGLSGRTQFPHLHLSVRHDGAVVDPFHPVAGFDAAESCAAPQAPTLAPALWQDDASPRYVATGVIDAGFAAQIPDYDAIKAGSADTAALPAHASALVLWAYAYGSLPGDELQLRIVAPDGTVFFHSRQTLDRQQSQYFRAGGKRVQAPLSAGTYRGHVEIWREGQLQDRDLVVLSQP
ncbi:M23 family metallopeptidase [Tritonibacter horizontis]|uniref:Murein DD-endopeptidase MepM n=1 Tax=Tritonibacter horizontis TaxID=1768241 RepID=A0A132BT67_9RHOB|nr:M23 family metallopeptidase [Tritonibacter horizontis]KUP91222.1 murein DD-endopeptidase MepM [Tritonibacter horizontis]